MEEGRCRTQDLPFAAFLASTRRLRFLSCEKAEKGQIDFVFEDPEGRGPMLYLEYRSGAAAPVATFYACLKYLRKAMDTLTGRGKERNGF